MTPSTSAPSALVSRAFQQMIQNQIEPILQEHGLRAWHATNNDIFLRMLKELSEEDFEHPTFPQSTRELSNFEPILESAARDIGWLYLKISRTQVELQKIGECDTTPEEIPSAPTEPVQPLLPQRGPHGHLYMTYEYGLSQHNLPVFRFLPYNSAPIPSEDWFRFIDALDAAFDVPKLQRSGSLRIVPNHIYESEGWEGVHKRIGRALLWFNRDPWSIRKDGLQGPGV